MNEAISGLENMPNKEREAVKAIHAALVGKTKEEACAIMCAVCALQGLYNHAIEFAQRAQMLHDLAVSR